MVHDRNGGGVHQQAADERVDRLELHELAALVALGRARQQDLDDQDWVQQRAPPVDGGVPRRTGNGEIGRYR